MDYTNEIWKWIPECEGRYMVSNFGRTRKHFVNHGGPNSSDGVITEFKPNQYGYRARAIKVVRDGNNLVKMFKVHRLVGLLFIDNPNNHPMLNHIDGVKLNNHHTNLEWITAKENVHHAVDTGLMSIRKLTSDEVREIRHLYNTTDNSYSDLAMNYNISSAGIYSCIKYLSWDRLDPHLKYDYKVNSLDGDELTEWLSTKSKSNILERDFKNLNPKIIKDIKYDYVNNGYSIKDIEDVYNVRGSLAKIIVLDDLPEVTPLKDEVFKVVDNYQVSNKGRKIKDGRISSDRGLKYIVANLFLPNPHNYSFLKRIDKNLGYNVDNLIWYDNKNKNDFDKKEIIKLYLNSNYSKVDMCTKSGMAEKYNITQEMIMDALKGIIRIKPHLCKTCGENNPDNFSNRRKSECKSCSNPYVKKGARPHLCKTCGEKNPDNFVKACKGECRKCGIIKARNKFVKKGPRPHLCKTCGEKNPDEFYGNSKGRCKSCSNKARKN